MREVRGMEDVGEMVDGSEKCVQKHVVLAEATLVQIKEEHKHFQREFESQKNNALRVLELARENRRVAQSVLNGHCSNKRPAPKATELAPDDSSQLREANSPTAGGQGSSDQDHMVVLEQMGAELLQMGADINAALAQRVDVPGGEGATAVPSAIDSHGKGYSIPHKKPHIPEAVSPDRNVSTPLAPPRSSSKEAMTPRALPERPSLQNRAPVLLRYHPGTIDISSSPTRPTNTNNSDHVSRFREVHAPIAQDSSMSEEASQFEETFAQVLLTATHQTEAVTIDESSSVLDSSIEGMKFTPEGISGNTGLKLRTPSVEKKASLVTRLSETQHELEGLRKQFEAQSKAIESEVGRRRTLEEVNQALESRVQKLTSKLEEWKEKIEEEVEWAVRFNALKLQKEDGEAAFRAERRTMENVMANLEEALAQKEAQRLNLEEWYQQEKKAREDLEAVSSHQRQLLANAEETYHKTLEKKETHRLCLEEKSDELVQTKAELKRVCDEMQQIEAQKAQFEEEIHQRECQHAELESKHRLLCEQSIKVSEIKDQAYQLVETQALQLADLRNQLKQRTEELVVAGVEVKRGCDDKINMEAQIQAVKRDLEEFQKNASVQRQQDEQLRHELEEERDQLKEKIKQQKYEYAALDSKHSRLYDEKKETESAQNELLASLNSVSNILQVVLEKTHTAKEATEARLRDMEWSCIKEKREMNRALEREKESLSTRIEDLQIQYERVKLELEEERLIAFKERERIEQQLASAQEEAKRLGIEFDQEQERTRTKIKESENCHLAAKDDLKSSREQSQLLEAKIERLEVRCAGLEKEKDRVQIDLQDTRKRLKEMAELRDHKKAELTAFRQQHQDLDRQAERLRGENKQLTTENEALRETKKKLQEKLVIENEYRKRHEEQLNECMEQVEELQDIISSAKQNPSNLFDCIKTLDRELNIMTKIRTLRAERHIQWPTASGAYKDDGDQDGEEQSELQHKFAGIERSLQESFKAKQELLEEEFDIMKAQLEKRFQEYQQLETALKAKDMEREKEVQEKLKRLDNERKKLSMSGLSNSVSSSHSQAVKLSSQSSSFQEFQGGKTLKGV